MADIDFEGKQVLVFRPGSWNGDKYSKEDAETLFKNTVKQGVDLPFRPHMQMSFFGGGGESPEVAYGWIGRKTLELADSGRITGTLSNVTEDMKAKLSEKRYRYVSPEIAYPNWEAYEKHDLTAAYIQALSPVVRPAIRPQGGLSELKQASKYVHMMEDGSCAIHLSADDWAADDAPETETQSSALKRPNISLWFDEGKLSHMTIDEDGDNRKRPIGDPTTKDGGNVEEQKIGDKDKVEDKEKELAADDADTETAAQETPAAEIETKDVTEDLAAREARVKERELEITKAKIGAVASALNKSLQLHKDHIDGWTTAMLAYDDTEKDDKGKTALDRQLEFEAQSRPAAVQLGETATADKDVVEKAVNQTLNAANLQLRRTLDFLRVNHGQNTDGAMDLSDRFDAVMKANPELKPWEAFNQAAREVYGKESE